MKVRCENYEKCKKEKCGHYWGHKYSSACNFRCYYEDEWKDFKCKPVEKKD